MADTLSTILALVLLFIVLPVVLLWLSDRRRSTRARRRQSGPNEARHWQENERRLLNPDWAAVERWLRRPTPQDLRRLYEDRTLVLGRDLACGDERISGFEPLDEQAIAENRRWLGFDAVTFAKTGFDDAVYLRPGTDESDRVYVTHHDGNDTEVLAESVRDLVGRIKP
jgi:hypothetical protein